MDKPKTENSGIRPGVIVAVVVVVAALIAAKWLGLFGSGMKDGQQNSAETPPAPVEPGAPQTATVAGGRTIPGAGRPGAIRPGGVPGITGTQGGTAAVQGVPPGAATPGAGTPGTTPDMVADWSAKLDDILGSNDDEAKKADLLLAMWKNLPEEGQIETMQHISNLLSDEKFPVLVQTLTNAAAPEAVLDIIMTDALNRPNAMKLPALLEVARTPDHPKAEEAREILEVFVDENHGTDWAKWEKAVKDWLKENPDEPEAPK